MRYLYSDPTTYQVWEGELEMLARQVRTACRVWNASILPSNTEDVAGFRRCDTAFARYSAIVATFRERWTALGRPIGCDMPKQFTETANGGCVPNPAYKRAWDG